MFLNMTECISQRSYLFDLNIPDTNPGKKLVIYFKWYIISNKDINIQKKMKDFT